MTIRITLGYDTGLIPADKQVNYVIDGISEIPEVTSIAFLSKSPTEPWKTVNQLRRIEPRFVFLGESSPSSG